MEISLSSPPKIMEINVKGVSLQGFFTDRKKKQTTAILKVSLAKSTLTNNTR